MAKKKRNRPRVYRLKLYTGPLNKTQFKELSHKIKRTNLRVHTTGTSHVYVDVPAADCTDARIKYEDKWQGKFGRKPSASVAACAIRGSGILGRRHHKKGR